MHKIKVVIADDHAVLRAGLSMLLSSDPTIQVVGEAADGIEAINLLEDLKPDILILDLSMPNMGGIECLKEIKSREINCKVVVLTMYEDERYITEVMRAGACGYVEKRAVDTELFLAIKTVYKGQLYLSSGNSQKLMSALLTGPGLIPDERDPYTVLSAREREVLKYIVRGYSMSEIAEKLMLSVKTIDTYKTRLMDKLNYSKKSELVDYAIKYSLLS